MGALKNFFAKIKGVKNIELYIALGLAITVLAAVLLGGAAHKTENSSADDSYIAQMEHKICSVVEKIEGCGKVSVAISYASNEEKVYAFETETTKNGDVVKQTSNIVSVRGEPLVSTVLPPKILGVVVVAQGADNAVTRYKIVNVVTTLLDVQVKDVQVLTYKS